MIFLDERLDAAIEAGAKRRPRYSTDQVMADGGWLIRNERWAYPLFSFEFNFMPGEFEGDETLLAIEDHFHVVGGSAGAFPFRDWKDFRGVDQVLGIGDGSTTIFQLYRNYTRGALTRRRLITRPVADTIVVRVSGIVVPFTALDMGRVELDDPAAIDDVVAADFEFNLPCHFADDSLELASIAGEIEQPMSIVIEQIREKPVE